MDVRLSSEQRALRDAAAHLSDRLGPRTVADIGQPERVAKLEAALASTGWRELRAAADEGGTVPLASAVEVAVVAEELGRRSADVAFVGPTLAADLRRRAGAPPAAAPETVVLAGGLSEPAMAVGGVLSDDAVAVDAADAAGALALASGPDGCTLAEVRLSGAATTAVDLTRPAVALDRYTKALPLLDGPGVLTDADIRRWTALGLAVACADLVGAMRGALDLARDYAGDRRQYGVPIGSFQAVQHLLADAHVALEGARSVGLHAAWAVDALPPADALAAAAVAKAWCARAARSVCETAIQVHGGIGNTWECPAHVHLRRALLSTDLLGGEGLSIERVLRHRGLLPGTGHDGAHDYGNGTGDDVGLR